MSEPSSKDKEFIIELTRVQMVLGAFLKALLPVQADIDSVLQEVNLTLWKKKEDFQPGSNFKAWAFQTAKFIALNERRKIKRSRLLPFDDKFLEILAVENIFEHDAMNKKREALEFCMQKVTAEHRELIKYRYSSHLSIEQYAKKSGENPGTLRNTLRRIPSRLKDCINQKLQTSEPGS